MKRIGIILGGFLAILALTVAIVPHLISSEFYKAQIEKQAEAALGRDVSLQGEARISIVPRISAKVGGMSVANPDGFSDANMIEAGELRARVKFWPLISGRVEIAEISLVDANVSLERLSNGQANWEFETGEPAPQKAPTEGPSDFDAGIDAARLVNSSLSYRDAVAGNDYSLTDFTGRASMAAFDKPLSFDGEGKLNGEAFDLSLDLTSIDAILNTRPAQINLDLKTDLGAASYDGEVIVSERPTLSGAFDISSSQLTRLAKLASIDPGLELSALGSFEAAGSVSGSIDALKLDLKKATQKSEQFSATFSGLIDLGSSSPLDGAFTLKARNVSTAAAALNLDLPIQLAPIGSVDIEGTVKGPFSSPKFVFQELRQNSDLMSTGYTGEISISDTIDFNGKLNSKIEDTGRVLTQLGLDTGPVEALEKFDFSGQLSGPLTELKVSGANLSHRGELLDIDFEGQAALGGNGRISGPLSIRSGNLRGLLDAMAVELTPGETLQNFSLKGQVDGTSQNLSIGALQLTLDDVSGTGSAGLDMSRAVPTLTANLNMPTLDLTPFLGETSEDSAPQSNSSEWSKSPLALDSLRAVDADVKLKTDQLTIGNIEIENADISASINGGNLKTDIAKLNAFGGDWTGDLELDASGKTPRLSVDMQGSNVAMKSILSTFANLQTVSGGGNLTFSATSTGNSMDALIRGLNGELKTDLADGAIKGFNIAQIVRSIGSIREGVLSGNLDFGLSPEAETDFTQFESALTIKNGVADIDLMRALNPAVLLDGKGRIDLANQMIDISITPSVDASGIGEVDMLQLNGEPFALPFRVSGNWLSPSVSIDNSAVGRQLRAHATSEIGGRISDELGGELGGLIGDALGVPNRQAPAKQDNTEDRSNEEAPGEETLDSKDPDKEPENLEDALEGAVEDLATDALSDLFGKRD